MKWRPINAMLRSTTCSWFSVSFTRIHSPTSLALMCRLSRRSSPQIVITGWRISDLFLVTIFLAQPVFMCYLLPYRFLLFSSGSGGRSSFRCIIRKHIWVLLGIIWIYDLCSCSALSGLIKVGCVRNIFFTFPIAKLWYMRTLLPQKRILLFPQSIHLLNEITSKKYGVPA